MMRRAYVQRHRQRRSWWWRKRVLLRHNMADAPKLPIATVFGDFRWATRTRVDAWYGHRGPNQ